jgi:hypothetical protein
LSDRFVYVQPGQGNTTVTEQPDIRRDESRALALAARLRGPRV